MPETARPPAELAARADTDPFTLRNVDPACQGRGGEVRPAVVRADLRRSRQAVFGPMAHLRAARFSSRLARAVAEVPDEASDGVGVIAGHVALDATDPGPWRYPVDEGGTEELPLAVHDGLTDGPAVDPSSGLFDSTGPLGGSGVDTAAPTDPGHCLHRVLPALRDAAFGSPVRTVPGIQDVVLPAAPALVCNRADLIVGVNPALLRLIGRADDRNGLTGVRLAQLVVGPETDARLVRADGDLVRVRVVRGDLPGHQLQVVVLVELGDRAGAGRTDEAGRTGTWIYELSTATLTRSDALQEIYRSVGIDVDAGAGLVEGEQVALLCRSLRSGTAADPPRVVELRIPGDRLLSCRAEVEYGPDGAPVRLVGVVRDLGPAQGKVQHSGQRFADLMALVPVGVGLLDRTGRVVDANRVLCALLDVGLEQLRGVTAAELSAEAAPAWTDPGELAGRAPGPLPSWLRPVLPGAHHGYRIDAVPLLRGDGTTVWCEVAVSATLSDDGDWFWMLVCADIGERRRAAELLRTAGLVDELTRLPNRAASLELVDRLLSGPGRDRVAVVCGDLDDFQRVNSSLGHDAGDELLVAVAGRLQRELPLGCTAGRLSGDEFVVICADHGEVGGPDTLARTVADLLRTTITVYGQPVPLTASVGLATPVPGGEVRAADLLRFAEAAMHDAKRRQCRGGIGVATDGVVSSATRHLELEAQLRAAIAGDGLVLEYQPVVGPDGTVLSAEALVRWPHPERGMIAPSEFLPVAQRSGLMRELDLWVLRAATREAAGWPVHCGRTPAVAVNLAGLLPGDPDFLAAVTEIVTEAGLAWDRLVLELVETSLVAVPRHALSAMAELVERGVRFAVDDFGTGYSSLARFKELPAQIIKVDRAFVTDIGSDPADFAVTRAVVDMARAMGRTTVAEGVETAEQFHVLRGIGVDAYQGWLFARSLAAPDIRALLAGDRIATPAASG